MTTTPLPPSMKVAFRPRARLLKLIGAELISDDVVALTELVKNAYDADATNIRLVFEDASGPDGVIEVIDDGTGMTPEVILRHWMEPGGSSKTTAEAQVTRRGRRVLGEKGVGRFAVDKLARRLTLISRAEGSDVEVVATFDWDQFNDPERMLEDIVHGWEVRPAERLQGPGTILRMEGLRTKWTERMFRRLGNRLGRLRSPFVELDTLRIEIESDEFPNYGGEIRNDILDRAPYQLEVTFDGIDTIMGTFNGHQIPAFFYRQSLLTCGPVRFVLYGFDLETDALAKLGPRGEVRAWMKEWSGVSIYRDGFRLWPYGEPHDDWLRLDQRRVNNPVERMSNNQVMGFLQIDSSSNPELRDQTNREGLINNRAFTDLRALTHHIMLILETKRQQVRQESGGKTRRVNRITEVADGLEIATEFARVAKKVDDDLAPQVESLKNRVIKDREQIRKNMDTLSQQYTELAAYGHTAGDTASSMLELLREVEQARRAVATAAIASKDPALVDAMNRLEVGVERLTDQAHRLIPPSAATSSRRRAMDVVAECRAAVRTLAPFLATRGFPDLELDVPDERLIRVEMRPEIFHRLLYILAMNSAEWKDSTRPPAVRLRVERVGEEHCRITFSDSGQGIPEKLTEQVFEPGFTWKEVGRGMGLTIARGLVEMHGGAIVVGDDGRRKGTDILIELPLKRARSV